HNDKKIFKRINTLLVDIKRNPNDSNGIGKPERLKENFQGYLSRRITSEHRLVYKIVGDLIVVAQCRYHY
ncbi:MAG: Txe/YoeB family addiction module toxin, partial [Campylobacterota bacterium]|nr:Txe/YoeB family addiction module toxin [Campylobacterota bacterium]